MDNYCADEQTTAIASLSNMFISVALASLICFIIAFKWKVRKLEALAAQLPGPPGWPIIGNALEFWCNPEEIFGRVMKLTKQYESPSRLWLGPNLVVLVSKPEDIQIVLNNPKTLEKSEIYRFFTAYIGRGLLTSQVEKWRRNRRLMGPAFNMNLLLKQFIPVFNKHNRILVHKMRCHINHGQFDVWNYIVSSSMDMICETVLGIDEKTPENLKSEFAEAVARGSELVLMRCYKFWLHSDIIFDLTLRLMYGASAVRKLTEQFHRLPNLMIEKKKEEYKRRNEGASDKEPKLKVFLEILLELSDAGANFTDDDLRDEVFAIIIAGYDTTAQTICFILLMLAIHQDIQEKVCEEILQRCGDSDRDITVEDLQEIIYTEMVIKETLRMYPIVPVFLRSVKEDIDLTHHKLPAGCTVAVCPLGIHMDPKAYVNPEKFNPENFSSEKITERHKYSYLPFSAGPRNCIGLKFAMLLMKTTMAHLIRNYRFSTDIKMEDMKLKTDFLLRCKNGYLLKIQQRKCAMNS